jgi:hypothetical protein
MLGFFCTARTICELLTTGYLFALPFLCHRLPFLPFSRIIYIKLHVSKKGDTSLPRDRTLFVANAKSESFNPCQSPTATRARMITIRIGTVTYSAQSILFDITFKSAM